MGITNPGPFNLNGKKVGLALGSGAARGLAHIGVLRVLQREGIPIDLIAGTSAGAFIGAIYARWRDAEGIREQALEATRKKMAPFIDPSLPRTGLIRGRKIKRLMASYIGGDIKFSDLQIPFACVATDIDTGEEVVFDSGPVPEALRASISVPALFTVEKLDGRYLVDGGLANPVPVSVARRMGADFVIAVNVLPDVTDRAGRVSRARGRARKEPNIFQVLLQTLYISSASLVKSNLKEADFVIEPRVAHIGAGDFNRGQEFIEQGELAAESAIPEIKRKLAALQGLPPPRR